MMMVENYHLKIKPADEGVFDFVKKCFFLIVCVLIIIITDLYFI